MKNAAGYGGIDRFRLIAALLVVGIHTYPLSSVSGELDFLAVHVLARVAVPFFLMVTGYFLMPRYLSKEKSDIGPLGRNIKKTGLLYAAATLLYLPVSIYAGAYSGSNIAAAIARNILFDGTFYHLWYLPASIIGVGLLWLLGRKFSLRAILGIAVFLYFLGLLGDSYYGLASRIPFVSSVYGAGFKVFSYNRSGFFYAPVFLAMGAWIAKSERRPGARASLMGFAVSAAVMLGEGSVLRRFDLQRHDSMYLALLPCVFFLFRFLLTRKGRAVPLLRDISMWVYILHPMVIIAVRGAAKVTGLTGPLVGNSVIHYAVVCLLSVAVAALIAKWRMRRAAFPTGRAWIELDMGNLRHNIDVLKTLLPESCRLMPAVKADAYGHGAAAVSKELNAAGIRAFCVASVLEGAELRRRGIKGEILVLGYTHPERFCQIRRYRLTQTVIDYDYAKTLDGYGRKIAVHLKIDTGMHRLGERSDNIDGILRVFECANLVITGIYTHLCAADSDRETDKTFTQTQVDNFTEVLGKIREQGFPLPKIHIQSSYGIFSRPDLSYDYARVGIALYGMLSTPGDTARYSAGLRPILSVKARVGAVKALSAGETAGYGLAFTAPRDMRIAILAIGYADGIPRRVSCGVGHVLLDGRKAPVVGRVCMDQMIVDITGIEDVKQGDIAVIIGKSGEAEITACEIAEQADTISNEIVSRLGGRLEKYVLAGR